MHTFYKDYLEHITVFHDDVRNELAGLLREAFDWRPQAEMNSLTVLVAHLAGAERYWIGDVVMGESSKRDRDAEFRQAGLDADSLIRKLDETLAYTKNALERLTLADLERDCISQRDGRRISAAWALLHALEHTALHVGHIQLTRQLWNQRNELNN